MELPVTYTVKDSNVLTVTNDGRLQAQSTTTGTIVRVSATLNGVIRTDSAWVNISDGALRPRVSQVSLQVPQGDSAKWAKSYDLGDKKLQLVRQDSSGANISALRVAVWSSDSTKATVAQSGNDVSVHVTQPGEVTFYVESYAYGSTFRDSLRFIVGWPVNEAITGYKRFRTGEANPIVDFAPGRIIVGAGACIQWYNISAMPVDVEFSDPSKAEEPTGLVCRLFSMRDTNGGNIASFQETYNPNGTRNDFSIRRGRTFNVPGIYTYRSKLYGTTGIIVVCGASNKTLPDCANNN